MGLLSALTGSSFDPLVDKATSEENTSENWALIMDICDRVVVETNGAKDCFRSVLRRLNSPIPVVVMQSLTLIDALVSNCGKKIHLEVCSREFENELRRLIISTKTPHHKVSERARSLLRKWAKEFKNDPQLSLIPSLYDTLRKEGVDFSERSSETKAKMRAAAAAEMAALKNPDIVNSAQEEADIAKAIELSLKDAEKKSGSGSSHHRRNHSSSHHNIGASSSSSSSTSSSVTHHLNGSGGGSSSLYPSFNLSESSVGSGKSGGSGINSSSSTNNNKEPIKVRALYDFEAAEDNELTFKAGEIILVLDNSDVNWWKGSNHRGEGLFPANFVSTDLNAEPEPVYKSEKKVQFNEEVKVKVLDSNESNESSNNNSTNSSGTTNGIGPIPEPVTEIDESRIDRLLHLLHEADPQSDKNDSEELLTLEEQCLVGMVPLIDQQIEQIDKRHASLNALNVQLTSALNLYHELMKESLIMEQQAQAAVAAYHQQMVAGATAGYGGYPSPGGSSPYHQVIAQPAPYDPAAAAQQQPAAAYQQYAYQQQQQQQPTQPGYVPGYDPSMSGVVGQQQSQPQDPNVAPAAGQQPQTFQQQQPTAIYQSPTHQHQQPNNSLASNVAYQQPSPNGGGGGYPVASAAAAAISQQPIAHNHYQSYTTAVPPPTSLPPGTPTTAQISQQQQQPMPTWNSYGQYHQQPTAAPIMAHHVHPGAPAPTPAPAPPPPTSIPQTAVPNLL